MSEPLEFKILIEEIQQTLQVSKRLEEKLVAFEN